MNKLPRPNFGIRLVSTLLCIILFLSMLAGILIADVRIITTKENTSKIIRESLFINYTVRPAAHRSGVPGDHSTALRTQPKLSAVKLAEDETTGVMTEVLVEFIYNSMTEQYGELPVDLETVEEFIEESTLQDELSDLSASLINDFITGENTTTIDEEMITNMVMENAGLIEDYFGVTVDEAAVSQMASSVVNNEVVAQLQEDGIANVLMNSVAGTGSSGGSSHENPSRPGDEGESGTVTAPGNDTDTPTMVAELNKTLETMRTALSATSMWICFGIAALCVILLCALNRKWLWYALRRIGFALIWSALPMLIPTAVVLAAPEIWSDLFSSVAVAGTITGMMLSMTAPVCFGVAVGGLVLVIASIVVKIVMKKLLAKKAATADVQVVVDAPAPETLPEAAAEDPTPAEEAPTDETEKETDEAEPAEEENKEEEVPVE